MYRRDFLPTYHFEDTENNEIKDLAEEKLRDYIVNGNHGKNLIPFPYVSKAGTQNGVDITIDDNGVITLNGTATETIYFGLLSPVNSSEITKPGKYRISGMSQTVEGISIQCYADGQWHSKYCDAGSGAIFTITSSITYVAMQINSGSVCDNLVVKPMLINTEESNILTYPYANTTKTVNGITFVDNKDGSINVNGTATGDGIFYIITLDKKIKYTGKKLIVGCPTGGNTTTYRLVINLYKVSGSTSTYVAGFNDVGSGIYVDFDAYEYDMVEMSIRANKDSVCENIVFNPNVVDMMFEPWCGVGDKTRNIIPYPYSDGNSKKSYGVTFTTTENGNVVASGTSIGGSPKFFLTQHLEIPPGKYFLSGCPSNISGNPFKLIIYGYKDNIAMSDVLFVDVGKGIEVTIPNDCEYVHVYVLLTSQNLTVDNLTFKPLLVDLNTQNLIPYPYARTTQTINGITFTDNGDGTITINGTATANVWYPISTCTASTIYATKGKYYLSGCPSGGSASTYALNCDVYNGTTDINRSFYDVGNGKTQDLNSYTLTSISVNFAVYEGATVDNLTFRPLLVKMDDVASYEPYGYKIELLNKPWNNLMNVEDFEATQTNSYYASKIITLTDSNMSTYLPHLDEMKGKSVVCSYDFDNEKFIQEFLIYFNETVNGSSNYIAFANSNNFTATLPDATPIRLDFRARSNSADLNGVTVKFSNITLKYEDIEEEKQDIYLKNQIMDGKEVSYKTDLLNDIILHKDMINDLSINSKIKPKKVSYSYYTYKYPNKNN